MTQSAIRIYIGIHIVHLFLFSINSVLLDMKTQNHFETYYYFILYCVTTLLKK